MPQTSRGFWFEHYPGDPIGHSVRTGFPGDPSGNDHLAQQIQDELDAVDDNAADLESRIAVLEAALAAPRWQHIDSGSETGAAFDIVVPAGYERLRLTLSGDHAGGGDLHVSLRINGDLSNHQYGFFTANVDTTGQDFQFVENASGQGHVKIAQWSSVESNLCLVDIAPADGRGGPAVLANGFRLSTSQSTNRRSFAWGKLITAAVVSTLRVIPDGASSFAACHWWLEGYTA